MHIFDRYIVKTDELLERLYNYAAAVESDVVVFDLESNSENEKKAETWGFGVCYTEQKAFYIPWRYKDGTWVWPENKRTEIIAWLKNELSTRKVVGHNIIYDVLVTESNFKFNFTEYIHADTILMKHTINEERPHGLKECGVKYLGPWADLAQDKLKDSVIANGGRWTKDHKDMYLAETDILGEYCCWDVMLTMLLYNKFLKQIQDEGLENLFFNEEIMPLYKEVTIDMKRKGFNVDVPYFEQLNKELEKEIGAKEDEIMNDIANVVRNFEQDLLDKKFPVKAAGNFPKIFADLYGIPLPVNKKTGKVTLSAKELEKQKAQSSGNNHFVVFYDWLLTGSEPPKNGWIDSNKRKVQEQMFFDLAANEGKRYIFNLSSGDHLGYILFDALKIKPISFTDGGKPSTDADTLDELIEQYQHQEPWLPKLLDYRKLSKIKSTYVEGILERQIDGMIYTSMLQFGTTSGRYSSTNPNLQNLPRIKDDDSGLSEIVLKYVNSIKKGFIAPPGYKILNADYSSLEPVCFAHASGDEKLRDVFRNGEDLYSRIAIDVFGLHEYSAKKKDPNYLGKHKKEYRQKSKIFCLAVVYGAEEARIADLMGVDWQEAHDIIERYLNAYPNLRKYMSICNYNAKKKGFVQTDFGRIRHLKEAKDIYGVYGDQILDPKYAKRNNVKDLRWKFKNLLNNAKNFPIQGLAGHICNRAMIATNRAFKHLQLDAWIAMQVHDEITCIVREDQTDIALPILQDKMVNTTKISVPLGAEPILADNWAEAK